MELVHGVSNGAHHYHRDNIEEMQLKYSNFTNICPIATVIVLDGSSMLPLLIWECLTIKLLDIPVSIGHTLSTTYVEVVSKRTDST
jgi:hypothetical protein